MLSKEEMLVPGQDYNVIILGDDEIVLDIRLRDVHPYSGPYYRFVSPEKIKSEPSDLVGLTEDEFSSRGVTWVPRIGYFLVRVSPPGCLVPWGKDKITSVYETPITEIGKKDRLYRRVLP